MTAIFADSSAIAKRYLTMELGSGWIKGLTRRATGNLIIISELGIVELFSVLARRQREKSLILKDSQRIGRTFLVHVRNEYAVVALDTKSLNQARRLLSQYKLRTLDSIQLASAIRARIVFNVPIMFISSDNDLLLAASSEGFNTDNPLNHP